VDCNRFLSAFVVSFEGMTSRVEVRVRIGVVLTWENRFVVRVCLVVGGLEKGEFARAFSFAVNLEV
jgi:hypothetical protein